MEVRRQVGLIRRLEVRKARREWEESDELRQRAEAVHEKAKQRDEERIARLEKLARLTAEVEERRARGERGGGEAKAEKATEAAAASDAWQSSACDEKNRRRGRWQCERRQPPYQRVGR